MESEVNSTVLLEVLFIYYVKSYSKYNTKKFKKAHTHQVKN